MEIERKYLVSGIPDNIDSYPCRFIEQGYLNTAPVVRVRRDNDNYYLNRGILTLAIGCRALGRLYINIVGWLKEYFYNSLPTDKIRAMA